MEFPRTYIDESENLIKNFSASLVIPKPSDKSIQTGTTIIAMVSADKKIGILASDGRVSGMPLIFDEEFNKVFDCRIGFFAGAGDLGLIQQIVPSFRLALNNICDGRGETVSASGASRHLMHYYRTAAAQYIKQGMQPMIAFLVLFWDKDEKKIHLYQLEGMAFMPRKKFASIGSGSGFVEGQIMVDEIIPETKEEMIEKAKTMIQKVSKKDSATNSRMYYGLIQDGKYTLKEEV